VAVAARAGVSRTKAKEAIREAKRLGVIEVRERRRPGARSLPNLVTIVDREWLAWLKRGPKRGGFGNAHATDNLASRKTAMRPAEAPRKAAGKETSLATSAQRRDPEADFGADRRAEIVLRRSRPL